jgi:hypothetical protein
MAKAQEAGEKKKFDMKVHHMDKKGSLSKVTPYILQIGPFGKRFIRAGVEFYANGEEVELENCEYTRQGEKRAAAQAKVEARIQAAQAAQEEQQVVNAPPPAPPAPAPAPVVEPEPSNDVAPEVALEKEAQAQEEEAAVDAPAPQAEEAQPEQ